MIFVNTGNLKIAFVIISLCCHFTHQTTTSSIFMRTNYDLGKMFNSVSVLSVTSAVKCAIFCLRSTCNGWRYSERMSKCQLTNGEHNGEYHLISNEEPSFYTTRAQAQRIYNGIPTTTTVVSSTTCVQGWKHYKDFKIVNGESYYYQITDVETCQNTARNKGKVVIAMYWNTIDDLFCHIYESGSLKLESDENADVYVYECS